MFCNAKVQKRVNFDFFGCSGSYEHNFFKPFDSFSDAKKNVKAILFKPVINTFLTLHKILDCMGLAFLGIANISIGILTCSIDDLNTGFCNIKEAINSLFCACYYAVSIITDCMDSLVRLATHSSSTLLSPVVKPIVSFLTSEPVHQTILGYVEKFKNNTNPPEDMSLPQHNSPSN